MLVLFVLFIFEALAVSCVQSMGFFFAVAFKKFEPEAVFMMVVVAAAN